MTLNICKPCSAVRSFLDLGHWLRPHEKPVRICPDCCGSVTRRWSYHLASGRCGSGPLSRPTACLETDDSLYALHCKNVSVEMHCLGWGESCARVRSPCGTPAPRAGFELRNVSRATGTVRTAYSDTISKGSQGNETFVYSNIQLGTGHAVWFNHLKPTGHVMHHQFNIQKLYVLPTLYLCVLYLSENKQRLVPLTA